jgi:transposase-like protein
MAGEVLSGPERRRRWGDEEKARLVAEIMAPGAKVTEIARRHGISRGLLYTWRREAGQELAREGASALPDLVPVVVADAREVPQASLRKATALSFLSSFITLLKAMREASSMQTWTNSQPMPRLRFTTPVLRPVMR